MLILKSEQAKLYISIKLFMNVLSKLNGKKFTAIKIFCLTAITLVKLLPRQIEIQKILCQKKPWQLLNAEVNFAASLICKILWRKKINEYEKTRTTEYILSYKTTKTTIKW